MDRGIVARFPKNSRGFVRGRIWIGAAALFLILPSLSTHLFLWRLERRLQLKIGSKPFFTLWPGSVSVKHNLRLEWSDQLKVTSGSLAVRFPLSALVQDRFSISLEGKNLMVEPGLGFREVIGQSQVVFDRFATKFVIDSRRISDIEYLDAESKTMEFHLNSKSPEKKQQKIPHEQ